MALGLTKEALLSMIDGVKRFGGQCDAIVCGSDQVAERVRKFLAELQLDFHVIADSELSPNRLWVTSLAALSQFPGGGRN